MRALLVVSMASLVILGCGSRSTSGWRPARRDGGGATPERVLPIYDGMPWWTDASPPLRDRAVVKVDGSCLPVPPASVQGSYSGAWKGTWSCPGQPSNSVTGELKLQLLSSGAGTTFVVTGSLAGSVGSSPAPLTISSSVQGSMSCVSLGATLPNLVIGAGGFLSGTGSLSAQFAPGPAPGKGGFPDGAWKVTQTNGPCTGSGVFYANKI